MPHFIIDCSEELLNLQEPDKILNQVYNSALSTNLFALTGIGGVKVRINPYKHYLTSDKKTNFIHVFAHIMGGRNEEQKKVLSRKIVTGLSEIFPEVPIISISIIDIDKASYVNKGMV